MTAKTQKTEAQAEKEAMQPQEVQQQNTPMPEPRMTGVITITEDGTVASQGITPQNALIFARHLNHIMSQLMNAATAPPESA